MRSRDPSSFVEIEAKVSKRCYVLGAGFSRPLGFPLARDLTHEIWCHLTANIIDFKPEVCDGWLSMLRVIYPFLDFKDHWPDFEELITVLDEWEAYRLSYEGKPAPADPFQPIHLKKVLLRHLAHLLCEELHRCGNEKMLVIRQFVEEVAEAKHSIVSFNWDLLLEAAAAQINLPVSYGGQIKDGLQVAKPHGSLNLAAIPQQKWQCVKTRNCINVHSISPDCEFKDVIVLRADDPRDASNRILYPFERPLLVEPSARKSYSSAWLDLQWQRATNMLRNADEIAIVGYSLPPADLRPRLLFHLMGLNRSVQPLLWLVDPRADQLYDERYRSFGYNVTTIGRDWQEWFTQGEARSRLEW